MMKQCLLLFLIITSLHHLIAFSTSAQAEKVDTTVYTEYTLPTFHENPFLLTDRERTFDVQQVRKHIKDYPDWFLYSLLGFCFLQVLMYLNFKKEVSNIFRSFTSINLARISFRDQEFSVSIASFLLNVNFVLLLAIYSYIILSTLGLNFEYSLLQSLLFISLFIAIIYIIKYVVLRILMVIFPFQYDLAFYLYHVFVTLKVLGFILMPLIVFLVLSNIKTPIIVLSLFIISIMFLYRYFQGLRISSPYWKANKFHFFIYICTLELAPMFLIIKIFESLFLIQA